MFWARTRSDAGDAEQFATGRPMSAGFRLLVPGYASAGSHHLAPGYNSAHVENLRLALRSTVVSQQPRAAPQYMSIGTSLFARFRNVARLRPVLPLARSRIFVTFVMFRMMTVHDVMRDINQCGTALVHGGKMLEILRRVWSEDDGQDIAEYAMMLAVILLIVAATVSSIGTNANTVFSNAANKLTTA